MALILYRLYLYKISNVADNLGHADARDMETRMATGFMTPSNEPPRGEKSLLRNYLDDIVEMSVLEPDEQIRLLETMEAAEAALREALAGIPETARILLRRWRKRLAQGRVTGALSRWHRDGSDRDCNREIDESFRRIESALDDFDATSGRAFRRRRAGRQALAERVLEAEVALPVLLETLETLERRPGADHERVTTKPSIERWSSALDSPTARTISSTTTSGS